VQEFLPETTMNTLLDGLPAEIKSGVHPDWVRNEAAYWAARADIAKRYTGLWIAFADGAVIAAGERIVEVAHKAKQLGKHAFVTRVGSEGVPQRNRYDGTVIHRSIPGFIWQGGGFGLGGDPLQAVPIATHPAIVNEPVFSNTAGTIAMAKLPGDPNSATSEWFFNVGDKSTNLDFQNGGFTASGMCSATG
jgi:cyclophilin family peptidyl-prolyl cis-trans isomerase